MGNLRGRSSGERPGMNGEPMPEALGCPTLAPIMWPFLKNVSNVVHPTLKGPEFEKHELFYESESL